MKDKKATYAQLEQELCERFRITDNQREAYKRLGRQYDESQERVKELEEEVDEHIGDCEKIQKQYNDLVAVASENASQAKQYSDHAKSAWDRYYKLIETQEHCSYWRRIWLAIQGAYP